MIKIEKVSIHGLEETIRGMRNPMNSWDKSDSWICKGGDDGIGCENCAKEVPCEHTYDHSFQLGKADHELMMKLAAGGPVHAKYRRMITVYLDITAPLYWWKEFDTYKVGTYLCAYALINRVCQCIEHCATARAYSKFRENGVLVKMDDVEAGIMKSKKEKDNVKETVS